jgi:hypothetical protein
VHTAHDPFVAGAAPPPEDERRGARRGAPAPFVCAAARSRGCGSAAAVLLRACT